MSNFIEAEVVEILAERPGLQRILTTRISATPVSAVRDPITDASETGTSTTGVSETMVSETSSSSSSLTQPERSYVLTQLIGPVAIGDRVIINTTAVDLGLGTGGWHVVHWNLARSEWSQTGPGHIMKLRYTSLQLDAGVAEEVAGYHAPESLDGMPVVACLLHSQIAAVTVAAKYACPDLRIAYVMTDQASLPIALSDLVHNLCTAGFIDSTITAGHAFGGAFEAVNVTSALGVAKARSLADMVVVSQGPGVVGTSTKYGFSGLEVAAVLDSTQHYGGKAIMALRFSDADERPRHRGLSHHSSTVLEATHSSVTVPIPQGEIEIEPKIGRHCIASFEVPDMVKLFEEAALDVTTMGRSVVQEPRFFKYAAAAGIAAAENVKRAR